MKKIERKKEWTLTPRAFHSLLKWFDEGETSSGHSYLEMRRRLVAYFDRKNCMTSDELADETLNRVTRRLDEEGSITSDTPAKYCYTVARFVFMEHLRGTQKGNLQLEDIRSESHGDSLAVFGADDEARNKEKRFSCLEQCTAKLNPVNSELIIQYYTGKERVKIENRRALAQSLGISINALSIRACRIRDKLEACVKRCVATE